MLERYREDIAHWAHCLICLQAIGQVIGALLFITHWIATL